MVIRPGGENLPAIKAMLIAVTVSSFTEKARNSVCRAVGTRVGAAAKEKHGITKSWGEVGKGAEDFAG